MTLPSRGHDASGAPAATPVWYLGLGVALLASLPLLQWAGWVSSSAFHTNLELVATLMAGFAGALAITRFYSAKSNAYLFLGTGLIGTAALDGYHAVVTSAAYAPLLPSALKELIPWSWVASRLFLAVMLLLSCRALRNEDRLQRIPQRLVYASVAVLGLATFAFFMFMPLPAAYYADLFFKRPGELVPGAIFVAALVVQLRSGLWKRDHFAHWLTVSLVLNVVAQLVYMPFSDRLFDAPFDVAHGLKVLSYAALLGGLLIDVFHSFRLADTRAADLEHRVAARTRSLKASRASLERFAQIAAHDIKAPLRDIDALAGWIAEDAGSLLPPPSVRHLEQLRDRSRRLAQMVDDLRHYSMAGRDEAPPSPIKVNDLLKRTIGLVSLPPGFELETPDDALEVNTPPAPLELVFRNLIGNAVKHHDKDSGLIRVEARSADDPNFIQFSVTDDGPGIAPKHHERIFRVFHTLRPRDEVDGSGIGLALVQKTVESFGGTIEVQSQLGEGTTFLFTWPVDTHQAESQP